MDPLRAAVITVSSSRFAHGGDDVSGERLVALAHALGAEVAGRDLVPDDRARISERLLHWCGEGACALVMTTGGTGFSPTDVTPEATRAVIERPAPGLAEAVREASRPHTGNWMLSRGAAGIRGGTLIVNLPGSPRSIDQIAAVLVDPLRHGIALMRGAESDHGGTA